MIWSNGSPGCWGDPGDTCASGGPLGKLVLFQSSGVGFVNVAIADDVTGGIPSLQMTSSTSSGSGGLCIGGLNAASCVSRDLSEFRDGRLQFDLRLESPSVTAISVTLFPSLSVQIPVTSLNQDTFVHQSIALAPDLFGTNGPEQVLNVFQIDVSSSSPMPNQPVVTLNDIKWTAD
jgi:hypothetical protein